MADKSQIIAKHNRTKAADDADNCRPNVPTVNGNPVTTSRKNENDMQISYQNCRSTDQSNTGQASNSNQTANINGSTSNMLKTKESNGGKSSSHTDKHVKRKHTSTSKSTHKSSSSSSSSKKSSTSSKSSGHSSSQELSEIKAQLKILTEAMQKVTPVVTELKTYDEACDTQLQEPTRVDNLEHYGNEDEELSDGEILIEDEPSSKRQKLDFSQTNGSKSNLFDLPISESPNHSTSTNRNKTNQKPSNALDFLSKCVKKKKEVGPSIDPDYASQVTKILENGMGENDKEEPFEHNLPPENCERLDIIKVNSEIFNNAKKEARAQDLLLQKVQKPLIAALNELVSHTDKFIKFQKEEGGELPTMNDTMQVLVKATALIADSSHELDLRRRQNFKPGLKPEYKSLCSDNAPVTTLLFGEQLSDQVKDIKETNKITYNVNTSPKFAPKFKTQRSYQYQSKPYSQSAPTIGKAWPFLGRSSTYNRSNYQRPQNNRGKGPVKSKQQQNSNRHY